MDRLLTTAIALAIDLLATQVFDKVATSLLARIDALMTNDYWRFLQGQARNGLFRGAIQTDVGFYCGPVCIRNTACIGAVLLPFLRDVVRIDGRPATSAGIALEFAADGGFVAF